MEPTRLDTRDEGTAATALSRLGELIERLRGEKGCPWDRKQTARSMSIYLLEEVYELSEAIAEGSAEDICAELGDVLFHVFFIARLFEEQGGFGIDDAAQGVIRKMIRRHPHVFARQQADDVETIRRNWHSIKRRERGQQNRSSVAASVPRGLPILIRAYRLLERAARAGLEGCGLDGDLGEVDRRLAVLKEAMADPPAEAQSQQSPEGALGEAMLALIDVARKFHLHPENALRGATSRFTLRLRQVEKSLAERGLALDTASEELLGELWQAAAKDVQ